MTTQIGQHTPTPWKTQRVGTQLFIMGQGKDGAITDVLACEYQDDRVNAAFIVQAVNSYEAMREAIAAYLATTMHAPDGVNDVLDGLRAALKLAEEGKE